MSEAIQEAMFPEAEAWNDHPVYPSTGPGDPYTPVSIVAALSQGDRARRVRHLTTQAYAIVDQAEATFAEGRTITGRVILFSGGDDSTALTHIFRRVASHTGMANTGRIGLEDTRQYVRDTSAAWGLPLIEKHGEDYRDLVIDQGFPGPAMHWKMYQRLKERAFRQIRAELVKNARRERVLFIGGRRRQESERREDVALMEREDAIIWVSPIAHWTKLDLLTYRRLHDVPRNPVSPVLHMSGECLCGAFAKPGELDYLAIHFPEKAAEIRALEAEVRAAGHPAEVCVWGHGKGRKPTGPSPCGCDERSGLFNLFTDDDGVSA